MKRLMIVDGSNLLFQMFYGMPARIVNHEGKAIQGTVGFLGALMKSVRMIRPTHLAVVFDGEHENRRCRLDESYKANRPDWGAMPGEELPFTQLPDIYDALDVLKVCHAETADCEADDWIADCALTAPEDTQVVILSQDSDFFQLISPRVTVLRYRGDKSVLCDEVYIREKLGICAAQYADWKCLVGDSADNIPGVRGIGPKTAALLLREYGSLVGILENGESIPKPAVRQAILESRERLLLNGRLIRLTAGAALPFSLNEMAWKDPGITTTQILRATGLRK